jgi:hypothetical protein
MRFEHETSRNQAKSAVDRLLGAVGAAATVGVVALAFFELVPQWAALVFAVWTAVLLASFSGSVARLVRPPVRSLPASRALSSRCCSCLSGSCSFRS